MNASTQPVIEASLHPPSGGLSLLINSESSDFLSQLFIRLKPLYLSGSLKVFVNRHIMRSWKCCWNSPVHSWDMSFFLQRIFLSSGQIKSNIVSVLALDVDEYSTQVNYSHCKDNPNSSSLSSLQLMLRVRVWTFISAFTSDVHLCYLISLFWPSNVINCYQVAFFCCDNIYRHLSHFTSFTWRRIGLLVSRKKSSFNVLAEHDHFSHSTRVTHNSVELCRSVTVSERIHWSVSSGFVTVSSS